jgi:hypothetical protein
MISICPIDNEKICEHELIREFKSEFVFRNDIEHDYFEGNLRDMISVQTLSPLEMRRLKIRD